MREVIEVEEKKKSEEQKLKKKINELEETLINTQIALTEVAELVIK